MKPETAKIGKTWQEFDNEVTVDYQNGEFDVLAGCEKDNDALDKAIIHKGKYLIFEAKARKQDDDARIQAVIETWGKVWQYFGDKNSEYKRAYRTDFEYYKNQTDIDIYISIN